MSNSVLASVLSGRNFERKKKELSGLLTICGINDVEFWKFVNAYRLKKADQGGDEEANQGGDNCEELFKQTRGYGLSKDEFKQFSTILCMYEDYEQRVGFKKIIKLLEEKKNLPIFTYRSDIVDSIKKNSVVIIAGDTGCGKSTQVPQYLLAAGFKNIACTQPRRIACISLSNRVSYEMLDTSKQLVGYQIRFEKSAGENTSVLFVTEGLLLRQVVNDPLLSAYDVIVIDEAHERHLHGDLLLGILKCILHKRSDLKLVLMSATINIGLFEHFFSGENPVIIQVPGRLFPVSVRYMPPHEQEMGSWTKSFDATPYISILRYIDQRFPKEEKGDVLIFLSGMSEIKSMLEALQEYTSTAQHWLVLPLHSSLSLAEQDKVFHCAPEGFKKCVVATNMAETSITIDGIRFVIDSGKMKEMTYNAKTHMNKLKECWVSKASAEQRKGRAGRTGPGECYRLYSEEQFDWFKEFTDPEMCRLQLDDVVLQLMAMGLSDVRRFPFLEEPSKDALETSIRSLQLQGALDEEENVTAEGKLLASLPVDVSIGKLLLAGILLGQPAPALALAAALSVHTPFVGRLDHKSDVKEARAKLQSNHGDPFTLLAVVREWLERKKRGDSYNALHSWCKRLGLEEQRFFEMAKLQIQFRDVLKNAGLLPDERDDKTPHTSSERVLREGERRLLHKKRQERHTESTQKRRFLEPGPSYSTTDDADEMGDSVSQVHHIEFQLSHNTGRLKSMISGASIDSEKRLNLLKILLISGLYPQVAVPRYLYSSEHTFDTEYKKYLKAHPNSCFGVNPEILVIERTEETRDASILAYHPYDTNHQILVYRSLMDTTRPYLCDCIRAPAAPVLLFFAKEIDTNVDFSRIICDGWIGLCFENPSEAAILLKKIFILRDQWTQLATLKLEVVRCQQNNNSNNSTSVNKKAQQAEHLSSRLSKALPELLSIKISYCLGLHYCVRKEVLFVGPGENCETVDPNPFTTDYCNGGFTAGPHPLKGGVRLTPFLTYNCLKQSTYYPPEVEWECPRCNLIACLLPLQQLQHELFCKPLDTTSQELEESIEQHDVETHTCENCNQNLQCTRVEMLRHQKLCRK